METIVIAFTIKEAAHGSEEYATEYCRQLKMQEQGLKKLTIREYLENRRNYKEQGGLEESIVKKREREKACAANIAELVNRFPVFSAEDTVARNDQLYEWIDSQVILLTQAAEEKQLATAGTVEAKVGESPKQLWGQGWAENFEEKIHKQKQAREIILITFYKLSDLTRKEQRNAVSEAMDKWENEEYLSVKLAPEMINMLTLHSEFNDSPA